MSELSVQQKNIINVLKKTYPQLAGCSDEEIISIMQHNGIINLSDKEKISIFANNENNLDFDTDLKLEHNETTTYNLNQTNTVLIKSSDDNTYNLIQILTDRINNVSENVKKTEDENGFLGSVWSGFKNLTGIGDSSDKVREQQEVEKKVIAAI